MNYIKVLLRNEWLYYFYSKMKTGVQKYIDTTFEANLIIPNLWLGALSSSCNREKLKENSIETIISAIYGSTASFPFDFDYERAALLDTESEDILTEINRLLPIIHENIQEGKGVLVHCMYGKSRSCTIVAAYLIQYLDMTAEESLKFILEKRPQIDPNPGYLEQLEKFSLQIQNQKLLKENKQLKLSDKQKLD